MARARAIGHSGDVQVRLENDEGSSQAVRAIVERLYWQRIWVVQEVRFTCQNLIMCGQQTVRSASLNRFVGALKDEVGQYRLFSALGLLKYAHAVLNPPSTETNVSLSNVIRTYRMLVLIQVPPA